MTVEPPHASRRVVVRKRRGPVATLLLSLAATGIDVGLLALALGGFPAVWAHARAVALIVVWAVTGAALALKRPIASQNIVEIASEPRAVVVALGLVPMLTPAIAAWGERQGLWILGGGAWLRWTGVAMVALGLTLRIAAMSQLGPRFSPLLAVQHEHALETTGLYRRIRHPGYLGSFLAALGAVMAFGSGLGLVPLALFGALMASRARREEALMAARFGDSWLIYRARSGAFFPRP